MCVCVWCWCSCAGCERPEEIHKRLQPCLASPPTSSARNDACLLATMQGMLCHRLTGRACLVLVGLGRHLLRVAKLGVVTFNQLEQALRTYHISLTTEVCRSYKSYHRFKQAHLKYFFTEVGPRYQPHYRSRPTISLSPQK